MALRLATFTLALGESWPVIKPFRMACGVKKSSVTLYKEKAYIGERNSCFIRRDWSQCCVK
jgi:hypothetical protein